MIVYLGMPKCASTWLYDKIQHNFEYDGIKTPLFNNLLIFSSSKCLDSSSSLVH